MDGLLLGIDGGASGLRVHVIEVLATGRLRPGGRRLEHSWEGWHGFLPVDLDQQLRERDALESGSLEPGEAERGEGHAWVHTLANAVAELTFGLDLADGLRLGVCMPGLKSADGRGILVSRNGPRIPDFSGELERQLAGRNLTLRSPLPPLASDGIAAGWGEEHSPGGLMGGVPDVYYLAAGTGVAEALKQDDRHLALDEVRARLPAPWSIATREGETVEDALSLRSLARDLADLLPASAGSLPVEQLARCSKEAGRRRLMTWATDLGEFLGARVRAIDSAGGRLDRIVVGQRSGALVADRELGPWIRDPLHSALETALSRGQDVGVASTRFHPDLLLASTQRAAPAIGAAAAALGLVTEGS